MATHHWALDPAHSEVQFKIRHLMITNVTGTSNYLKQRLKLKGRILQNLNYHSRQILPVLIPTTSKEMLT
jgi:hypothetical protein